MAYQLPFRTKSKIHLPLNHFNDETAEAAYAETEREAMASRMPDTPDLHDPPKFPGQSSPSLSSEPPSPLSSPASPTTPTTGYATHPYSHFPNSSPNISLQTATKQAFALRCRIAETHAGWNFAALALWHKGLIYVDEDILNEVGLDVDVLSKQGLLCPDEYVSSEMESEMGELRCQLERRYQAATHLWSALLETEEGKWFGEMREGRLRTLGLLEGMLACWEPLVNQLFKMLKDGAGGRKVWEIKDGVWEILSRWREGLPGACQAKGVKGM